MSEQNKKQNVKALDESLCYLIGAIDAANDHGIGWRKRFISLCKNKDMNIKFLDPTNKVTGLQTESSLEKQNILAMKQNRQWEELQSFMHKIVREDHRSVDLSDFVVFYLDPNVHTCGSYFELQSALTQHKPYFIIIEGGKEKTPGWLFGICDHNCFYDTIGDVVDELSMLHSGEKPLSDRWVLFRRQLKDL